MNRLEICNLVLQVQLGCTPEERKIPQEVRFTVELFFPEAPPACITDQLSDTVCYAKICDALRFVAQEKEFATVEHLSERALDSLKGILPHQIIGTLHTHKVSPPVESLLGGVIFTREIR